jgi:hypothetical protein
MLKTFLHLFKCCLHTAKDYRHIIVLRAQLAAGGHFVWDFTIIYFYIPSYNKEILYASSITLPDSYLY